MVARDGASRARERLAMTRLQAVVASRRTPWLRDADRWLSGPDLLSSPTSDDAGTASPFRLVADLGPAAVIRGVLACLHRNTIPVLWPARVRIPDWLRAQLADPGPRAGRWEQETAQV